MMMLLLCCVDVDVNAVLLQQFLITDFCCCVLLLLLYHYYFVSNYFVVILFLGKGKQRSNGLSSILRFKGLSTEAKLSTWKALVLEYGTQVWWPNKTQSMRLERIQLRASKRMLGISSKTSDIALRIECGVMSLQTRCKVALLKWVGKISRMADNRLVKYKFDNVEIKWRGRGSGNRKTWKTRLLLTLNDFGLDNEYNDVATLSEDKWNKLVDNAALVVE